MYITKHSCTKRQTLVYRPCKRRGFGGNQATQFLLPWPMLYIGHACVGVFSSLKGRVLGASSFIVLGLFPHLSNETGSYLKIFKI